MKQINITKTVLISSIIMSWMLSAATYEKSGEYAGQFLKIAQSARYAGMAEAVCSYADGAQAMGFNPAGTADDSRLSAALSYSKHLLLSSMVNVHYKQNLKPFTIGAGFRIFIHGKSESFDENDIALGTLPSALNLEAAVNVSKRLAEMLSLGANLKYLYEKQTDTAIAHGFSTDLGILLHFEKFNAKLKGFNFGLSVQNLGTPVSFDQVKSMLPITLRTGVSYARDFSDSFGMAYGIDLEKAADSQFKTAIGTEVWIKKLVSLQAGYRIGEKLYGFRYGLGLNFKGHGLYYNMEFREIGVIHHADYVFKLPGKGDE